MNEEKGSPMDDQDMGADGTDDKKKSGSASRARNRTVMLTPEMTGQVRALLHQDPRQDQQSEDPLEDFLPPLVDWDTGANAAPPEQPASEPEPSAIALGPGNGHVEEAKPSQRAGTAKFSRNEIDDAIDSTQDYEGMPSSYDPMTHVGPPIESAPPQQAPVVADPTAAGSGLFQNAGDAQSSLSGSGGFMKPQTSSEPMQPLMEQAPAAAQPAVSAPVGAHTAPTASPAAPAATAPAGGVQPSSLPQVIKGKSKIVGFLVSFDSDKNGEVYQIRAGRWLVTSRPTDHGEYVLINDETISPLHAILRATKDGKLQVLDQLSEYGTGVIRSDGGDEIEVAGGLETVHHGDTIRFGERYFLVCAVPEAVVVADEG